MAAAAAAGRRSGPPRSAHWQSSCQLPGCGRDLAGEIPYARRFSFCKEHLTAESIEYCGITCRFCQQCARFQSVEDFDGAKRSCRLALLKRRAPANMRRLSRYASQ
ncbi:hypothetical protein OEZ85_013461 [Tetradesmus obliquus]|uniref:SBP-type domain-containing protein n=1 Tax=Tetradesmus obliquus TaxID=3088 RepID=A0ABY8UU14_TETOB|nr:hypothetical protein OEZ85_013461 [Tetradesmus obliquus]